MVKEKPNSTRIYDKDGFRQRAACICVRSIEENEVSFFFKDRKNYKISTTKEIHKNARIVFP